MDCKVIFRNVAINEKEAMSMKESKKGYMKGFGGWKGKGNVIKLKFQK